METERTLNYYYTNNLRAPSCVINELKAMYRGHKIKYIKGNSWVKLLDNYFLSFGLQIRLTKWEIVIDNINYKYYMEEDLKTIKGVLDNPSLPMDKAMQMAANRLLESNTTNWLCSGCKREGLKQIKLKYATILI